MLQRQLRHPVRHTFREAFTCQQKLRFAELSSCLLLDGLGRTSEAEINHDTRAMNLDGLAVLVVLRQPDDTTAQVHSLFEAVRNEDDRDPVLLAQVLDHLLQGRTSEVVEPRVRLIHKDYFRAHDQRCGNGHPLTLTARELARVLVQVIGHEHIGEHFFRLLANFGSIHEPFKETCFELQAQHDVFDDRQMREGPELLVNDTTSTVRVVDRLTVNQDSARGGLLLAEE
ncbi:MAG: hypothetical protein UT91_C0019G0033 [Parcubacteria group bacterium GW2011_GWA2_40_23]|nr:MAG: hypothetical protein UT91_C0019G0033 [Parcubacteria group bacterium GW2011_GWA2_40_23]